MAFLLPLTFLAAFASLFGLVWMVIAVDPHTSPKILAAVFIALLFVFVFCGLGVLLYFVRTRFYRRFSANWYFKTSFKMSFFVALFVCILAGLLLLRLVNIFYIGAAGAAVMLLALWAYLGKR